MSKKRKLALIGLVTALVVFVISTQITIFVVPPIGAVPEGRTIVISRMNKTKFIDSADAMCDRIQGGVSLLCRGAALGAIGQNAKIYVRLPYSRALYLMSTEGKEYDR